MRNTTITLGLFLLAAPLLAAEGAHHHERSVWFDDASGVVSCDQLHATFGGEKGVVVAVEVPEAASMRALSIDAKRNGGIRVTGWDDQRYGVTVCKAASTAAALADISVRVHGNEVTAEASSDSNDTMVYFLVRAPRQSTLDLEASNGPVSVAGTGGSITVRTSNGPVSLDGVDGSVDAAASNGPITFSGSRGTVKLTASNGPISVRLSGTGWENGSLDARTTNGPVSLKVPRSYASGILVESEGRGPVSCRADACRGQVGELASRDTGGRNMPRRIELGSGANALHLSTSNGPISIGNSD